MHKKFRLNPHNDNIALEKIQILVSIRIERGQHQITIILSFFTYLTYVKSDSITLTFIAL